MCCKEFVFLQSSGQIKHMSLVKKIATLSHMWICGRCRNFRHNDDLLTGYIGQLKKNLLDPQ